MRNLLKITQKLSKILFLSIFIVITSCSSNDKKAFNIIDEAKKLLLNITEEEAPLKKVESDKKKNEIAEKDIKITKEVEIEEGDTPLDEKKVQNELKASKKLKLKESKLIQRKKKEENLETQKEILQNNGIDEFKTISPKLKVGVLLPITGEHKEIGNLILKSLELALFQNDIEKIELIIKDTKADPKTTESIFNDLLKKDVKLFIGPLFSKSLVAIENRVREKNIRVFSLSNNTNLAKRGLWIFGIDPQQQIERILNFVILNQNKKIGLLLPDNPYGYLLYNTALKTMRRQNFEPTRVEFFKENINSQQDAAKKISKGFQNYEEFLKEIQENNEFVDSELEVKEKLIYDKPLDSILIAASGQALTILASQLQYSSVDPKKVIFVGISSWQDDSILQEPALKGGIFTTTSDLYQKEVSKIYSLAYGTEMPKIGMIAYDILSLMASSYREYGSVENNYLLNKNGYLGLRGLFRLNTSGVVERTFQIKKIMKSKFVTYQEAEGSFNN